MYLHRNLFYFSLICSTLFCCCFNVLHCMRLYQILKKYYKTEKLRLISFTADTIGLNCIQNLTKSQAGKHAWTLRR